MKYRPAQFEEHQKNHDWVKNCAIRRQTVARWVETFKSTGYHRRRGINKIRKLIAPTRPETGPESILKPTITEYQKSVIVHEYWKCKEEVRIHT